MRPQGMIGLCVVSVVSLASVASAGLVNIDIQPTTISETATPSPVYVGAAAGGFAGTASDAWNPVDIGAGYPTHPPTSNLTVSHLKLADGVTDSGVSFTLLASEGSPTSWSGYSAGSPSNTLRQDGLNLFENVAFQTSSSISWQLAGLVAGGEYDLNMFGWANDAYIGTWAVSNASASTSSQTTGGIATFNTVVADSRGVISGTFSKPVNALQNQTFWTGMQIQGAFVPEPTSLGLLGLGAMLMRRKPRNT